MIELPHSHPGESTLHADVCIVGSGPAGIALAREFLGTRTEVLLLESGGYDATPAADALNDGENAGDRPLGLHDGRLRAFGGAGRLWAGQCVRLAAGDFKVRPWVAHSGWPIGLADLEAYYDRADALLGVRGETSHDGRSLYAMVRLRPLEVDAGKLGHVASVYAPAPDLGANARAALARSVNVRVALGITMTRLVPHPSGAAIAHGEARALDGRRLTIKAKAFVLCAGGIENARLLLASNGIGNGRDLVGRFLLDHPNGRAGTIALARPAALQDRYGLIYRAPYRFYPKLTLSPGLQRQERVLAAALMINSDFGAGGVEAARQIVRAVRKGRRPPAVGRALADMALDAPRMARTVYRRYVRGLSPTSRQSVVWLQTYCEQAPHPASRVRLGDRTDAFGVPLPVVEWRLTDLDRRTAQVMVSTVAAELARLGLGRVHPADWLNAADGGWSLGVHDAYHPSGTTRMSDDPSAGVVDRDCRVHGTDGLYVAGSSVFPTVGYANPTLTIVALAIRLADHLKTVLTYSGA